RAAPDLGGEDLHEVAALQPVVERDDPAVDLRADHTVADVGVNRVGEVDRRRARRQYLHLALRREDVDLVREEVGAEGLEELARPEISAGMSTFSSSALSTIAASRTCSSRSARRSLTIALISSYLRGCSVAKARSSSSHLSLLMPSRWASGA